MGIGQADPDLFELAVGVEPDRVVDLLLVGVFGGDPKDRNNVSSGGLGEMPGELYGGNGLVDIVEGAAGESGLLSGDNGQGLGLGQ